MTLIVSGTTTSSVSGYNYVAQVTEYARLLTASGVSGARTREVRRGLQRNRRSWGHAVVI